MNLAHSRYECISIQKFYINLKAGFFFSNNFRLIATLFIWLSYASDVMASNNSSNTNETESKKKKTQFKTNPEAEMNQHESNVCKQKMGEH